MPIKDYAGTVAEKNVDGTQIGKEWTACAVHFSPIYVGLKIQINYIPL